MQKSDDCLTRSLGHRFEPPRPNRCWLCSSPRLSHRSHCLQIRWALGKSRSSIGQDTRRSTEIPQVRWSCHGQDDPIETHGRREIRWLSTIGSIRRPWHASNGRRRCHQGCWKESCLNRQGHQISCNCCQRWKEINKRSPPDLFSSSSSSFFSIVFAWVCVSTKRAAKKNREISIRFLSLNHLISSFFIVTVFSLLYYLMFLRRENKTIRTQLRRTSAFVFISSLFSYLTWKKKKIAFFGVDFIDLW